MTKTLIKLQFILFICLSCSCARLGTKTLYKNELNGEFARIGFSQLDGNRILSKIYPPTNYIFKKTFYEAFQAFNYKDSDITYFDKEIFYDNPDTATIVRLCTDNNLDIFILSRLKFIHTNYSLYLIPAGRTTDTEVQMKVFDKKGKLQLAVLHNTVKGNSYFSAPTAGRTVKDGTEGSIKRIASNFGLRQQNGG